MEKCRKRYVNLLNKNLYIEHKKKRAHDFNRNFRTTDYEPCNI